MGVGDWWTNQQHRRGDGKFFRRVIKKVLTATVLEASPHVLHGEGAISQDRRAGAVQIFVRYLVVHPITYVALELFLTLKLYASVRSHAPWEGIEARNHHLLTQIFSLQGLDSQHIASIDVFKSANEF